MKKLIHKALAVALLILIASPSAFSQVREKREVSNFSELSVSHAFVVELSVGDKESLEIEAEERYIDDIITYVRGERLVIRLEESRYTRRMKESPRIYLTVKSLEKITLSGAVNLTTFDALKADRLSVDISGASVLKMEIDVDDLSFFSHET